MVAGCDFVAAFGCEAGFSAAESRSDLPLLADERAALRQADSLTSFCYLIVAVEPEAALSIERPEAGLTQFGWYHSPAADWCSAVSMCQTQVASRPDESHLALSVCWT